MGAASDFDDDGSRQRSGCFVSTAVGILLFLLAVAVAVGVGLLVHFAHPDKNKSCTEIIPEDIMDGNCPDGDVSLVPDDDIWEACVNISIANDECIPSPACDPVVATELPPDDGEPIVPEPEVDYRIPLVFTPTNYDIRFRPDIYSDDPEEFEFTGGVIMSLTCEFETDTIYFHTRDITLVESSLTIRDDINPDEMLVYISIVRDDVTEIVSILMQNNITAGTQIELTVHYFGPITDDMAGMYYSYYEPEDSPGQTQYMLSTQFQSTDARKAFPCLDEPHFRPTYTISIDRQASMTTLCNTPLFESILADDPWITDHYETTVGMPTYLVAWAVSAFDNTTNVAPAHGGFAAKPMGYFARPDQIAVGATDWAMAICPPMFNYLEEYFNEQYTTYMPKLDQIAIPQFSAGAMENWGLATYREIRMLVDRRYAKIYDQQRASGTLAHELLHKWIGNLLTCEWWDELWLNEGFARYFQHLALQYGTRNIDSDENPLYTPSPAWPVEHAFISQVLQPVLASDDSGASLPIIGVSNSPASIEQMFSTYTYDKGGSLLRMFDNVMGDNFQLAQRNYIQAYKEQSVTTDLFLAELDETAENPPVGGIGNAFRTFLYQMGVPVVQVTRNNADLTFNQEMFLLDTEKPIREIYESPYNYTWTIPVSYTDSVEQEFETITNYHWLYDTEDSTVPDAIAAAADWYVVNPREVGYYRVNYDVENWEALISVLNDSASYQTIHAISRAAIIDDAFKLARSGYISQVLATRLSEYLGHELDWIPFDSFNINLPYLAGLYALSPDQQNFHAYIQRLVASNYDTLNWNVTTDTYDTSNLLEIYLMERTLKLACEYGVGDCREEAVSRYTIWRDNPTDLEPEFIKPDVRDVVYCYGFRYHDEGSGASDRDFQMMLQLYSEQEEERERDRLRDSLACASEPYLLATYYELAQSGNSMIREADRGTVMRLVAGVPEMQGYVWTQLNENWDDNIPGQTSTLQAITDRFSTEEELQMFDQFVLNNQATTDGLETTYSDIRYSILANIRWQERNGLEMSEYLQETNNANR